MKFSEKAVEAYGEKLASEYNADLNAWYIESDHIEFEFTRMNDKWWTDVPFDEFEDYDED